MNKYIFVCFIFYAASGVDSKTILKTKGGRIAENIGKPCSQIGILCDCNDVNNVYVCVRSGNDFIKIQVDACQPGYTCITSTSGCSNKTNYECDLIPNFKLECTSDGMFPDPYNCKKYHICAAEPKVSQPTTIKPTTERLTTILTTRNTSNIKLARSDHPFGDPIYVDHAAVCDEGYGYDPLTTFCKIKLKNNECASASIQSCTQVTLPRALPENPAIYYACVKLTTTDGYHPKFYKCPHGEHFGNGSCGKKEIKECGDLDGFYADPHNCLFYYSCTTHNHSACPESHSFNPATSQCERGYHNC